MTYKEIIDWVEANYDLEAYDDFGELYEDIVENWEGRGDFEDIMSIDDFINEIEGVEE